MREDFIHFSVRKYLKELGWKLVAGQYPNGSDDELPALNIMDPALCGDNIPEPRKHSKNKFVPDLVATLDRQLMLIEMKPKYSLEDDEKLTLLIGERKDHLLLALSALIDSRRASLQYPLSDYDFVAGLGFEFGGRFNPKKEFVYFQIKETGEVVVEGLKSKKC